MFVRALVENIWDFSDYEKLADLHFQGYRSSTSRAFRAEAAGDETYGKNENVIMRNMEKYFETSLGNDKRDSAQR